METTKHKLPARTETEIFRFTDYRAFLHAHFADKKRTHKSWSYGAWAKHLGLKNSTSILKILNGTREAGPEITEKLIAYFKFSDKKRRYFEDLIQLSKVEGDPARKTSVMDRLRKQHPKREFTLLDDKNFSAISHWWFYGIRQFTRLKTFRLDPDWIAARFRFKITPREVSNALKTMSDLGVMAIDPIANRAQLTEKSLNTSDDIASEALKRFHEEALALAREAIRSIPLKERQISGITLAVKAQDVSRMKEFLRNMEDEFCAEFERPAEGDSVYQLHTALFPLTKSSNSGENQ